MGLWERIYLRADAKIPRRERGAGLEIIGGTSHTCSSLIKDSSQEKSWHEELSVSYFDGCSHRN